MRYDTRARFAGSSFSSYLPAGVKWLLISNVAIFLIYFFASLAGAGSFFNLFALVPRAVVGHFAIWQLFTYLFLHSPAGFSHILLNMLSLWMFGSILERDWGTKQFLRYYFVCGVGAGICVVLISLLFGQQDVLVIGASGAIYGLLMAFGLLYPNMELLFFFLFPIRAKYYVMIVGAMIFLMTLVPSQGVSNLAHLGGMLVGYLYLKAKFRTPSLAFIGQGYREWKLRRAKKKFQVYMRKHGSGDGPPVH